MRARLRHHLPALGSILVRGLGVVSGFGVALVIGRNWGPEANGVYALVTQTAIFLSLVVAGGLDLAIVRFFAAALGRGHRIARASYLRTLAVTSALVVAVAAVVLAGGGPLLRMDWLSQLPAHVLPLLLVIFAARAFTRVIGGILRAYGNYVLGQAVDGLFIPAIVFVALAAGWLPDVAAALDLTAGAGLAAVAIGLLGAGLARRAGQAGAPIEHVPIKPVLIAAVPIWGLGMALSIADWYGLAIVAAQQGTRDAGLYRIAMQFASAFAIVSVSLFGVYSPRLSAAHANGDWQKVARLALSATRLGTALVLPPALVFIVAAPWILAWIGAEFVEASTMMRVAVVGQVLGVALGPTGITLAMIGREKEVFVISLVCTLAMLAVTPIAAGHLGALGVVLSLSGISTVRSLAEFVALKRLAGVNGLTGRHTPPARAA